MTLLIPLKPFAAQELATNLSNQRCRIRAYQRRTGFFLDLYVNDAPIVAGVLCHSLTRLVREEYLGFVGDLMFYDTQGNEDPRFDGLGTRHLLLYLEPGE